MKSAADKGEWVCLKNLHLSTDSLHELEREIGLLSQTNGKFKVWLTTAECNAIPSSLIKRCFKITYEAPAGLKESVKNSFARWEDLDFFGQANERNQAVNAYFVLAWIHATVHERQSLGRIGWKQNYDFNHADLKAAELVFEAHSDLLNSVETIRYFLTTYIYGGKINNVHDELILSTFVEKYFCAEILVGSKEIIPGLRIDKHWDGQSYRRAFRLIPKFDSASDFGLPLNSFRSLNVKTATYIVTKLRELEPCFSSFRSKGEWIQDVKGTIHYWENLVKEISELLQRTFHKSTTENHLLRFFESEIQHGQHICHRVTSSFELLENVSTGKVDDNFLTFRKVRNALMVKSVPDTWEELWSGPSDVYEWMTQIVKKMKAINLLLENHQSLSKSSINLSNFFRSQAFLNMMKLKFCRENQNKLDEVSICACFESTSRSDIGNTFNIHLQGLFLRGCRLRERNDGSFVALSVKGSSPEFIKSPTLRLKFATQSELHLTQSESISIPVYSHLCSEEVLFHVTVGCERDSSRGWILAGPALFLECRR